jgi:RHS repeat-associated protein
MPTDKVNRNRKTAMLAEQTARQAKAAAAAAEGAGGGPASGEAPGPGQNGNGTPPPKSTTDKAVDAANTALKVYGDVMGAYGQVIGATGALAEKAVVAVFSKLKFMQGLACLPASSQLDPVIGIDVHFVMIPPSPSPIPMPHPYIAMVFDPKDFIACAVMSVKAMVPPPPPDNAKAQLASTVGNMAFGMIMGKLGLGASVKLGGFTPRTISGVTNKTIPHFPMGASFAPLPILKNSGHAQFGSLFLLADGEPFTGMMHLNNDCWDVGIMQLFRKKASPKAQHLFMPTGFVMAIPSHNVIVNPIPTPMNPIAALTKLLNFGIAKLLHKLISKIPGGRLSGALHKAVCHVTGHPVDVVSGMLFSDEEDFALPGVIPFSWERTWYSDSIYEGPLGHGWYHNYDMAFAIDEKTNQAAFRMNDGRMVGFELPLPGKFTYDRAEKLFLHRDLDNNFYYIEDREGLIYRFTETTFKKDLYQQPYDALKSISNKNGYAIRFEYDNAGNLTKIIDSASRELNVENDEEGHIINIIAPHPKEQNKKFTIAHYDYDELGNMICHTDALGQRMKFEYEQHLLVKETWRDGMQWYFRYEGNSNGSRCIHTWGDGNIYNHKLTYLEGCTMVENSLGHTTSYYHNKGLLYNKVDANGGEWGYRYNRFNELEWKTDPVGNQMNYSHDDWGNIITTTDPCGGFMSMEYYFPKLPLLPTAAMDAAGGRWKWEYNKQGNLVVKVNPLGAITKYEYEDGLLVKVINGGANTTFTYDDAQNITGIQTDNGAETQYDYDKLGKCLTILNPKNVKQRRILDGKGRIKKIYDFDGNIINLEYDGIDNVICYTDKQKQVEYTYHGLWKLTSRTEAGATINFQYDTEEQLVKIVNEHKLFYRFHLDPAGNVIEEVDFDSIARRYERNQAGWVTKILRPGGNFTKYGYDACGRVSEVFFSDSKKETYSYRRDGELLKASNEFATVEFEKNVLGDILKETVNDVWIASEYDILGNIVKITSSLGANITHEYSRIGDVSQIEAGAWRANFEYDKLGLEINRRLPGGISNNWNRDGIGRPVVQAVEQTAGRMSGTRKLKQYQWDVNSRLKQIKDEKGITRFEHDEWSNLAKTTFSDGEEQLRNSDRVGNLFKSPDRKDRLYGNGGQLKKANGWRYEYDEEGHLIQKKHTSGNVWRYDWNAAGMLVAVRRPDSSCVTFTYDALGRRLSKKFKNTVTNFAWNGKVPLHEWKENSITGYLLCDNSRKIDLNDDETDQNNSGIITWLFDVGTFIPSAKIKGKRTYSIITDHLGTPVQMYKEDGSLFWECELDSYGKVRIEKGEFGSCPFRFQGQYEDLETGLYYNRFRYYSVEEGVYISPDPIGINGGNRLYSYVQDTTMWVDALGLQGSYPTKYHKRSTEEIAKLRHDFEKSGGAKEKFLKSAANHPDAEKKYGKDAVAKMKEGKVPDDMVVHHKKPLFRGGTNDDDNLKLLDKKYHNDNNKGLHWYEEGQNPYGLN